MFQQISDFFGSIPFFNSLTFAVIAMVIVGSSWCLVGLVMGDAPKKGVEASLIQFCGAAFSTTVSLIIMVATSAYSPAPFMVTFWTCLCYFVALALGFFMVQCMSVAMQEGPNGVIWGIIQSALVFPFLGGILFFGVQFTLWRGIGIVLLITALVLFVFTKDNTTGPGKKSNRWKILAFIGMAVTAIQQNLSTMPSYFEAAREVPSILRTLSGSAGTLFMATMWNLCKMDKARWQNIRATLKNRMLWKYTAALQFFSLIFTYTLFYPGLDIMAKLGMGGMCYPMMVGCCIVSFTLASVWLLKEKLRIIHILALISCLAGLVCICTR